jgi:hypothetical protein
MQKTTLCVMLNLFQHLDFLIAGDPELNSG